MERMTKKQFAEYVATRLPMDHMIRFRGIDAAEDEVFYIANIHAGDESCYVANHITGGSPFCFTYGVRAVFVEYAIKAFHKYLCSIPTLQNGIEICTEEECPTMDELSLEVFSRKVWGTARWRKTSEVYRIRCPKQNQITFRIIPMGEGAIVTATEPLYNKDNVRFCCDVTQESVFEDFTQKVSSYLLEHGIEETVMLIRYK